MSGGEALRRMQPGHFAYSTNAADSARPRACGYEASPIRRSNALGRLTGAAAPRDAVMHCIALCWSASLYGWIGDWSAVEQMAGRLSAHAGSHALAPYQAVAAGFRAQTMIARGELKEGIELLQAALPRLHADRYELYASAFISELSQGLAELGHPAEGLRILHEAIARIEPAGEAFDGPELLRLRGELEARGGDLKAAEASFAASIALAEKQGRAVVAAANGNVAGPPSPQATQGEAAGRTGRDLRPLHGRLRNG